MPPTTEDRIPEDAEEWFEMVQEANDIGSEASMHVAHTNYHSGSKIRPSEFLHLRAFWQPHAEGVSVLRHYMGDAEVEGSSFKGYVSSKNMKLAGAICQNLSGHWREYRAQVNANASCLTSDQSAGPWSLVRMWQALVGLHTKKSDNRETSQDIEEDCSHIIKAGYTYKAESQSSGVTREFQSTRFFNQPLQTPERRSRPAVAIHGTPAAISYSSGLPVPGNVQSVDEMYSNMALLLFLQATTTEATHHLGNMTWIPPRLALKLTATTTVGNGGAKIVELMRALVDGYLCKRHGEQFEDAPLAICEAKPFIRSKHLPRTQRQETAEMASWIAHHGDSKNGLLQNSASGRKRRLLISQDRHEIYIIIGEYGDKYQEYIRGRIALKAKEVKPTTHESQSHRHQAAGSEASVKLAQSINDVYFEHEQLMQQQQQKQQKQQKRQKRTDPTASSNTSVRTMSTRSLTKAAVHDVPQADEFLIMHQFGPFLTHKDDHMEIFLRRIVAFMLELRGDESQRPTEKEILGRFPRPNAEFLEQDLSRSFPPRSEMKMHPSERYRR